MARGGDPQRARAQAARPRALRRGRGRGDDVAAGGDRRRAQLGLPLLLGPRLGVHAQRVARAGCAPEARAYFWWLMHASQLTHPRLRVLYRLDGGARAPERTLPLDGYRGSRPVRVGNAAAGQLQLDTYGELLQTAWLYATTGHRIDRDIGRRLAEIADLVCRDLARARRRDLGGAKRAAALHPVEDDVLGRARPRARARRAAA